MGSCDLWLTATAQHHDRVLYHISLAWRKIKIENIVSTEYISLCTKVKLKNPRSNHHRAESICISKCADFALITASNLLVDINYYNHQLSVPSVSHKPTGDYVSTPHPSALRVSPAVSDNTQPHEAQERQ
jgi:hypothetical protein